MKRILFAIFILLFAASTLNAAQITLEEETDTTLGDAFGEDFNLTMYQNWTNQGLMNTELYTFMSLFPDCSTEDQILQWNNTLSEWECATPTELSAGPGIDITGGVISATGSQAVTEQSADPTSASTTGFYGATSSGDFFYKSDTGLFNISLGTYTADPTLPTLSSATIGTDGTSLTLVASEAITIGSGGNGGWDVDCSAAGSDITATYSSGDTTDTLVYTLGTTVNSGDTCDVDYTQPGDGWEGSTGNDLANITSGSVTNNSAQVAGTCVGGTTDYIGLTLGASAIYLPTDTERVYTQYFLPTCDSPGCTTGSITTAYVYDRYTGGYDSDRKVKICLYDDEGAVATEPDNGDTLVGCTGEIVAPGSVSSWLSDTISGSVSCSNGYHVVVINYGVGSGFRIGYDTSGSQYYQDTTGFYASPSATLSGSWTLNSGVTFATYITIE